MRPRVNIEVELKQRAERFVGVNQEQATLLYLILEVLLDIRDILDKRTEEV